jgi:hypothetical protein
MKIKLRQALHTLMAINALNDGRRVLVEQPADAKDSTKYKFEPYLLRPNARMELARLLNRLEDENEAYEAERARELKALGLTITFPNGPKAAPVYQPDNVALKDKYMDHVKALLATEVDVVPPAVSEEMLNVDENQLDLNIVKEFLWFTEIKKTGKKA